ncbi:MAG: ankyrin repeat domain-containing protein [Candidatus Adiutrix sp.]|nr:ankyrin repeat domain-containing protein [Candidatus Adiutrix sp.]
MSQTDNFFGLRKIFAAVLALGCLVLLLAATVRTAPPSRDEVLGICLGGTVEQLAAAVAAGADVNAADGEPGPAPLVVLVFNEPEIGVAKAEILLKAGADVNAKDSLGATVLHQAVISGHLDFIRTLLVAGADVNAIDNYGNTPLVEAAGRSAVPLSVDEHIALLKLLLDAGADIRHGQPRTAPLTSAAFSSEPEIIELLLEAGCLVNEEIETGYTSLMAAAARNSNPNTVKTLLKAGADVTLRNDDGETALDVARARQNQTPAAAEIINMLEAAMKEAASEK